MYTSMHCPIILPVQLSNCFHVISHSLCSCYHDILFQRFSSIDQLICNILFENRIFMNGINISYPPENSYISLAPFSAVDMAQTHLAIYRVCSCFEPPTLKLSMVIVWPGPSAILAKADNQVRCRHQ